MMLPTPHDHSGQPDGQAAAAPTGYADLETTGLRPYQAEMVDASVAGNKIVVMDTGTGKTGVAIMRARITLESDSSGGRVWVVVPTTQLCVQQAAVFSRSLLMFGCRSLSGADGVDLWSHQSVWDAALLNMRLVVSTPDVLRDALSHGFVSISSIRLLVFDEAHHVVGKNHSYHRIMADHYFPAKSAGSLDVPTILGLSASPSVTAKILPSLKQLERRLDSTIVSPTIERTSLAEYVFRPRVEALLYSAVVGEMPAGVLLLREIIDTYDFSQDPYNLLLQTADSENPAPKLSTKTNCFSQLSRAWRQTTTLFSQLGSESSSRYLAHLASAYDHLSGLYHHVGGVELEEIRFMSETLRPIADHVPPVSRIDIRSEGISNKTVVLFAKLAQIWNPASKGIIFVSQRATAIALASLIRSFPPFDDKIRVAPAFSDLGGRDKVNQIDSFGCRRLDDVLADFRTGQLNLLVSTSVLEEGIDVADCNCIVSFDPSPSLSSFLQRRGRARQENSVYLVMEPEPEEHDGLSGVTTSRRNWETLEMSQAAEIEENNRSTLDLPSLETDFFDAEKLKNDETGATLSRANSIGCMYNFFSNVMSGFFRCLPVPVVTEIDKPGLKGFRAKYLLPASAPLEVSEVRGDILPSIGMAKMDAAFKVSSMLYRLGHLNSNFLPGFGSKTIARSRALEKRMYSTARPYVPWKRSDKWFQSIVHIEAADKSFKLPEVRLLFPNILTVPKLVTISLSATVAFTFTFDKLKLVKIDGERERRAQKMTAALLDIARPGLLYTSRDFAILIDMPASVKQEKIHPVDSVESFSAAKERGIDTPICIARTSFSERYIIDLRQKKMRAEGVPIPHYQGNAYAALYDPVAETPVDTQSVDLDTCYFEMISPSLNLLAVVYPRLVSIIEDDTRVDRLNGIISNFGIKAERELVRTAISLPMARRGQDYEYLEFWGDRVLKMTVTIALAYQYATQSEGYLTTIKGRILSNAYLAEQSRRLGLDEYLIDQPIHHRKWSPPYMIGPPKAIEKQKEDEKSATDKWGEKTKDKPTEQTTGQQQGDSWKLGTQPAPKAVPLRSTKMLGDVVEALVGAVHMSSGQAEAWKFIQVLMPSLKTSKPWAKLLSSVAKSRPKVDWVEDIYLTKMIGHNFRLPGLLLEATTSPALIMPNDNGLRVRGYDVLELIGDSVLDYIVVSDMLELIRTTWSDERKRTLGVGQLSKFHAAVINADFLAFCLLGVHVNARRGQNPKISKHGRFVEPGKPREEQVHLWRYLRHHDFEFVALQARSYERYLEIRDPISRVLFPPEDGTEQPEDGDKHRLVYPWGELTSAELEKPFSDMLESILGAIFIDSGGDINACRPLLENSGVLPAMRRIVTLGIDTDHPIVKLNMISKHVKFVTLEKSSGDVMGGKKEKSLDGKDPYSVREFVCSVVIGSQVYVENVKAESKISGQTLAASKFLELYRSGKISIDEAIKIEEEKEQEQISQALDTTSKAPAAAGPAAAGPAEKDESKKPAGPGKFVGPDSRPESDDEIDRLLAVIRSASPVSSQSGSESGSKSDPPVVPGTTVSEPPSKFASTKQPVEKITKTKDSAPVAVPDVEVEQDIASPQPEPETATGRPEYLVTRLVPPVRSGVAIPADFFTSGRLGLLESALAGTKKGGNGSSGPSPPLETPSPPPRAPPLPPQASTPPRASTPPSSRVSPPQSSRAPPSQSSRAPQPPPRAPPSPPSRAPSTPRASSPTKTAPPKSPASQTAPPKSLASQTTPAKATPPKTSAPKTPAPQSSQSSRSSRSSRSSSSPAPSKKSASPKPPARPTRCSPASARVTTRKRAPNSTDTVSFESADTLASSIGLDLPYGRQRSCSTAQIDRPLLSQISPLEMPAVTFVAPGGLPCWARPGDRDV